ncbi:hypothetical protein J007_06100 [Cryptococcus neoformans]|nr:hypothetical protein J007_06100 [Cryptococcus neoformans var. grubii]OXC58366.1 hypothetical protein C358_06192 [Cryptococcus neoformans var. grubii MW-RSA852]
MRVSITVQNLSYHCSCILWSSSFPWRREVEEGGIVPPSLACQVVCL